MWKGRGALLTVVLTVIGLLIAGLATYFGWKALSPPKRQLTVTALPSAPLLPEAAATLAGLRVTVGDEPIGQPHLVTISISNTGRHDVSNAQYNGDVPIRIDLQARVVRVLQTTVKPQRGTEPPVVADDQQLRIGPGLLSRDQTLQLQVLVDGEPAPGDLSTVTAHDLTDVDVSFRSASTAATAFRMRKLVLVSGVLSVAAATSALTAAAFTFQLGTGGSVRVAPDHAQPGDTAVISGDGYGAFALIEATLNDDDYSEDNFELGDAQADADGGFTIPVTLPRGINIGQTSISVAITTRDGTEYETVDFAVTN